MPPSFAGLRPSKAGCIRSVIFKSVFAVAIVALPLALPLAHAQQYESEVRELERAPANELPKTEQERLAAVADNPYALALTLRELAGKAAEEEDYGRAIQYLKRAIDSNGLSGIVQDQMRLTLGELYQNAGEFEQVIQTLGPRVRAGRNVTPEMRLALGAAYAQLGRFREAQPHVERAVADWAPESFEDHKIKKRKTDSGLKLQLKQNPDILRTLSRHKQRPALVIGFAAETQDLLDNAKEKLGSKGCDWILANDVAGEKVFGAAENHVYLVTKAGAEEWPRSSKTEIARKLTEKITEHLSNHERTIIRAAE